MVTKRWRISLILLVFLLIVPLLVAGCAQQGGTTPSSTPTSTPAPTSYKIASIGEYTGELAGFGEYLNDAGRLYLEDVNAKGGINGIPIELFKYDDESDTERVTSLVTKAIEQDNVIACIGPVFGSMMQAGWEAARGKKVLMFHGSPGARPPYPLSDTDRWFFTTCLDETEIQRAIFVWLKDQGVKTIAQINSNDMTGREDYDTCKARAAEVGIQIIDEEWCEPNAIDVTVQMTKAKASGAQSIYLGGSGDLIIPYVKSMKLVGLDLPTIASPGLIIDTLQATIGFEPKQLVFPAPIPTVALSGVLPENSPRVIAAKKLQAVLKAKKGQDFIKPWEEIMWDAAEVLVEGIKRAGPGATREQIRDAVESIRGLEQCQGQRNLSRDDHCGLASEGAIVLLKLSNGQLVPLK